MKIIEPSTVILEPELAGLSVCQRIDRCASVCYQRNPKPTEDDAQAFCRSLIERGHLPALEMAVIHLWMPWQRAIDFGAERYLSVALDKKLGGVVSGSIRAFMEILGERGEWVSQTFLAHHFPLFFERAPGGRPAQAKYTSFATPEEIPWQHRHVAVRVICSRSISHQLVRHRPCSFLQESARFCKYDDGVTFILPEWVMPRKHEDWFSLQCSISESSYLSRRREGLSPQQARGALIHDVKTELIMYASLPEWKHIFAMRCGKGADPEMRRIMSPLREQFRAKHPEMWEGEKA